MTHIRRISPIMVNDLILRNNCEYREVESAETSQIAWEWYTSELVMPAPDIANEANFIVYICSHYMTRSEVGTKRISHGFVPIYFISEIT